MIPDVVGPFLGILPCRACRLPKVIVAKPAQGRRVQLLRAESTVRFRQSGTTVEFTVPQVVDYPIGPQTVKMEVPDSRKIAATS
jgi:hypothetical protein